jgi:DNA-binding transcriptional ArsR family regulator
LVCPPAGSKPRSRPAARRPEEAPPERGTAVAKARLAAQGLIQPNIHIVTRDPLRVQILSSAMVRAISAIEFSIEVDIPYSTASYHFRVLREAGFLELVEEVSVKGAAKRKLYRATRNGLISDAEWGNVEDVLKPGVAGAILQDFNVRTSEAIETGKMFSRDDATLYWIPRSYDGVAYEELMRAVQWIIDFQNQLQEETIQRRASGESADEDCINGTFAVAAYPSPTPDEVSAGQRRGKRDGGKSLKKPRSKGKK